MKKSSFKSPLSRLVTLVLFGLLAMGACKSKKKVVEAAPEPAPVEEQAPAPAPDPEPTAEEVAVGKLEGYFSTIASASSVQSANSSIQEALSMFSNQNTPVLIVIHEENGIKDYDEPTNIAKYLNYLKDTKKNLNFISDVRLDGSGKITELELRRR
ncbi:nucleoid-structuring protein H-NS [Echinicola soli]|uniref:Nucleoid-structuring protein H-NS n=1 Tax=Echinicola soli TaxID=2591634 RepID=A0A514CK16_9BACT|nr:nucleoid-structuring protein H-NS [Echinicola soli]QDH80159.1 nucleoid-structuring protein H-NS [Echinicola soli]